MPGVFQEKMYNKHAILCLWVIIECGYELGKTVNNEHLIDFPPGPTLSFDGMHLLTPKLISANSKIQCRRY